MYYHLNKKLAVKHASPAERRLFPLMVSMMNKTSAAINSPLVIMNNPQIVRLGRHSHLILAQYPAVDLLLQGSIPPET